MPVITAIKQQQKNKDRYSVFVDGAYSFSLSEGLLVSSGVHSGKELTDQELAQYKQQSQEDKLWNNTLRYAARQPRACSDVRQYLVRKQVAPELVERYTEKLEAIGLLNDSAFAEAWVRNRRQLKSVSTRRLRLELQQKQISSQLIEQALGNEGANSEQEALQELIRKKRRQSRYQDDQKLKQYLARQGFGFDDINAAIAEQP